MAASPPDNTVLGSIQQTVSNIWNSLTNSVHMETYTGSENASAESQGNIVVDESYPEVRHVSLTLGAGGASNPIGDTDQVYVQVRWDKEGGGYIKMGVAEIDGEKADSFAEAVTVEFDAAKWNVIYYGDSTDDDSLEIYWNYTVTYPVQ